MLLIGALTLREAYEAVEWPILVMLGALIPVSDRSAPPAAPT